MKSRPELEADKQRVGQNGLKTDAHLEHAVLRDAARVLNSIF